jgi:hypothetical protein
MRLAGEIPVGDVAPPTGKHALVFEAPFQLCRHKDGFTPETSLERKPRIDGELRSENWTPAFARGDFYGLN